MSGCLLMREKQVVAIYVKNRQGNIIYGKTRNDQWESTDIHRMSSFDDFVMSQKEIVRKNARLGTVEALGTVEVLLTMKFVKKELRADIVNMIFTFPRNPDRVPMTIRQRCNNDLVIVISALLLQNCQKKQKEEM
jgi:hypothetical protein